MLFEKTISTALAQLATNFFHKNLGSLNLNGNNLPDVVEAQQATVSLIAKCEKAYHSANLPEIAAAGATIVSGFQRLGKAVDVPLLMDCLQDAQAEVKQLAELAVLWSRHLSKSFAPKAKVVNATAKETPKQVTADKEVKQ